MCATLAKRDPSQMAEHRQQFVIAGAGSIGCYVGGCLALSGCNVVFLARPRIASILHRHGLNVTDLEGRSRALEPTRLTVTDDPQAALRDASVVLVTVKSAATEEMAGLVDRYAPQDATVISLQNGVENAGRLQAAMQTHRTILAGMVAFNVVMDDSGEGALSVHRATEGDVLIQDSAGQPAKLLSCDGLPVKSSSEIGAVLWGKLLLNLNNAINALSDLPLATQLGDRSWRRLLATQMDEALRVMEVHNIRPAKLAAVAPSLLPTILRLPNWLFQRLARRMLAIDPKARSSMWEDLVRRRITEIDEFQGAIIRLGLASGTPTPVSTRIVNAIRDAEAAGVGPPGLKPDALS